MRRSDRLLFVLVFLAGLFWLLIYLKDINLRANQRVTELRIEIVQTAMAVSATPTSEKATPSPTPEPSPICIPQSEDPAVFVVFGGQEIVPLSRLLEIRLQEGKPISVSFITPQGHHYSAGASNIQPGPDFCVLIEEGWLPRDFTGQWPPPPELETERETFLLDGALTTITYSNVSTRSLLYPTAVLEDDGCAKIFWDYDQTLGPLASKWSPKAAFTWYTWRPGEDNWHGWIESDPPCSQRCCRPWPQEFTASFGGWEILLILNEDFDQSPFGPIGVRSYWGPWGTLMVSAITTDGGQSWSSFYSCADIVLKATRKGQSIEVFCD